MVEDIPVAGTPLDPGLFSGKRRSPRKQRTLIADIGEPGGTHYEARTVDVSRGGMLLEFVDDKLRAPSDPSELVGFATRLMLMFPTGMDTTFGSGAVRTHAAVVRLVSTASAASPILLGCRFDAPLTDVDCRLLGLDLDGDETDDEGEDDVAPTAAAAVAQDAPGAPPAEAGFDDLMNFLKDASRSWDFDLPAPDATEAPADADAPATLTPATLTEDDVALSGRRAAAQRPCLGTPMSPPWAEPGEVVTHLFPVGAPVFGPRYRGPKTGAPTGNRWVTTSPGSAHGGLMGVPRQGRCAAARRPERATSSSVSVAGVSVAGASASAGASVASGAGRSKSHEREASLRKFMRSSNPASAGGAPGASWATAAAAVGATSSSPSSSVSSPSRSSPSRRQSTSVSGASNRQPRRIGDAAEAVLTSRTTAACVRTAPEPNVVSMPVGNMSMSRVANPTSSDGSDGARSLSSTNSSSMPPRETSTVRAS